MPLYEYQCEECGLKFEVRQKFSDPVIETCRECGGKVQKLISQTAFTLKGGGWYQEGYVSSKSEDNSPKKRAGESTKPSTKTSEKPSTSGDSCATCPKVANG